MMDSATPTLRDLLVDYFNREPNVASVAFHEGDYDLWGSYHWKNKDLYVSTEFEQWATHEGIDKPSQVDSYGGEDEGSNYYKVIKFTRGSETVFIKFWGWYASYDGAEYQDFSIVTPKEKTVVVYE